MTPSAGPRLIINTDGASRGNPGPGAAAVVVQDENGEELSSFAECLGVVTNNQAEYRAFLMGLKEAVRLGAVDVEMRSDSEFLVRQINGEYRVKDEKIKPLYAEAIALIAQIGANARVRHVPREENRRADELANEALDDGH